MHKKILYVSGGLIIVFVLLYFYYRYEIETPISGSEETVSLTIEEGQRVNVIAAQLAKVKVIRSPLIFKIYLRLNGLGNSLQAGDYEISRNISIKEVVEILQHGTFDVRLTFIEGWRVEEMADYIGSEVKGLSFSGVDFLQAAKDYEGKLFPDTYIVPKYISAYDLVDLMVFTFNQKISEEMYTGLANSNLNADEALILASIVERETKYAKDRPIVAGILLKRYQNNWMLEADATVQYVLGFQTELDSQNQEPISSWWKRTLTQNDLDIDSPYNTRNGDGLPPTPICSPGIDSLRAIAFPIQTDYWYYVSDSEGQMHYAETLEEHNRNVINHVK